LTDFWFFNDALSTEGCVTVPKMCNVSFQGWIVSNVESYPTFRQKIKFPFSGWMCIGWKTDRIQRWCHVVCDESDLWSEELAAKQLMTSTWLRKMAVKKLLRATWIGEYRIKKFLWPCQSGKGWWKDFRDYVIRRRGERRARKYLGLRET
jgi:hypothetical protein